MPPKKKVALDWWKIEACMFASENVTWKHIKDLIVLMKERFGDLYDFAPLHRSEGGINCLRWPPNQITTEDDEGYVRHMQGERKGTKAFRPVIYYVICLQ